MIRTKTATAGWALLSPLSSCFSMTAVAGLPTGLAGCPVARCSDGSLFYWGFRKQCVSTGDDNTSCQDAKSKVKHLVKRYESLSYDDRMKLVQEHMKIKDYQEFPVSEDHAKKSYKQSHTYFKSKSVTRHSKKQISNQNRIPEKLLTLIKIENRNLQNRNYFIKNARISKGEESYEEGYNDQQQLSTLSEDRNKAEKYEYIYKALEKQWPAIETVPTQFFDVMSNAIRDDLLDQSRPVLVNELADYENPYMMKRAVLTNLLEVSCVRTKLDESLVNLYLDKRADLIKLRSTGKMPPEVIEPLMAFRGDVHYSYDNRTRLEQKLDAIQSVFRISANDEIPVVTKIVASLPENQRSDEIHENHPFLNHFGFQSMVPSGFAGGIKMGKLKKPLDAELEKLRYPTLQRVAHSMPSDPKYRANVVHAIRVLERSKGWDYGSKLKAINILVETWKNMAASGVYEKVLDTAFPVFRRKGMVRRTMSRQTVFNRGLRYIRSTTTQRPLHARKKK